MTKGKEGRQISGKKRREKEVEGRKRKKGKARQGG